MTPEFQEQPQIRPEHPVAGQNKIATIREVVAVFHDPEDMQAAIDDLQSHGIMRQEISVLASESAVQEKLGHMYQRVQDAEDDPEAPRMLFISSQEMGVMEGAAISLPLFVAATAAAGAVVASGGLLLDAIIYAATAGAVGAGIGSMLATFLAKRRAEYLQEQIQRGGLLLWVHLNSPELEKTAMDILSKHSAEDVHVHDMPVYEDDKPE